MRENQNPWWIVMDADTGKWEEAYPEESYSRAVCSTRDPGQDVCVQWAAPTFKPTRSPSVSPTDSPSTSPTKTPTSSPTTTPTKAPVAKVVVVDDSDDKPVKKYDDLVVAGASTVGGVTKKEAEKGIKDALMESLDLEETAIKIISITKVVRRRLVDGEEIGSWIIEWEVKAETIADVKKIAEVIREDTFEETVVVAMAKSLGKPANTVTFTQAKIIVGLEQEDEEGGKLSTAVIVVIALVGGSLFICGILWGIYKFMCGKSAPGTVAASRVPQDA